MVIIRKYHVTYNNTKSKSHRNSFEFLSNVNNLSSVSLLLSLIDIVHLNLLCTHNPQFSYSLERLGICETFYYIMSR